VQGTNTRVELTVGIVAQFPMRSSELEWVIAFLELIKEAVRMLPEATSYISKCTTSTTFDYLTSTVLVPGRSLDHSSASS
jgi:hypothetical protein